MPAREIYKKNNALLAPMAGVTDMPFRVLCREQGAGLVFTEMVSAKGLHYGGGGKRSKTLLVIAPEEAPCGVQLFGSDPDIMAEQAKRLEDECGDKIALLDINMGCPAPKITSNGEGSALMKTPELASRVITAVKNAVKLDVTVKFRSGWDENSINAVEFAKMAEDSGADAVTVHGRTRMQFYSGKADWNVIKNVVDAVSIPVIGNGDIFSAEDAKRMLEYTGCAGVMAARGARGDPFLFARIRALLDRSETISKPDHNTLIQTALRHARMLIDFKDEGAIIEMRKHIAWYITGFAGSAAVREKANRCKSYAELEELLSEYARTLDTARL